MTILRYPDFQLDLVQKLVGNGIQCFACVFFGEPLVLQIGLLNGLVEFVIAAGAEEVAEFGEEVNALLERHEWVEFEGQR